ncbi:unnamed protein product [Prunus armeniaca]
MLSGDKPHLHCRQVAPRSTNSMESFSSIVSLTYARRRQASSPLQIGCFTKHKLNEVFFEHCVPDIRSQPYQLRHLESSLPPLQLHLLSALQLLLHPQHCSAHFEQGQVKIKLLTVFMFERATRRSTIPAIQVSHLVRISNDLMLGCLRGFNMSVELDQRSYHQLLDRQFAQLKDSLLEQTTL